MDFTKLCLTYMYKHSNLKLGFQHICYGLLWMHHCYGNLLCHKED